MYHVAAFILIATVTTVTLSKKCTSFHNVQMTLHPDKGQPYRTNVTGCIERIAFEDTIVRAYAKNQNIPILGPDSVRNMKHLHSVSFDACDVENIQPGAFRNVPNLKSVGIINGKLVAIPGDVFSNIPKLEVLKLYNNRIRSIQDGAFGGVPTLKKLHCAHNELRNWERSWFLNNSNLEVMDFSHNKIQSLPRRAFYNLDKLRNVSLDYNELEVIQQEAFKGVSRMEYLGLRYNKLEDLDAGIFPNKILVDVLRIDANYLNFLSKELMAVVTVKEVTFDGNPWKCPCMDEVLVWLHGMNATVVRMNRCLRGDVPVCSFAVSSSRSCTEVVDESVTKLYLDEVIKIEPPLDKYCARLD